MLRRVAGAAARCAVSAATSASSRWLPLRALPSRAGRRERAARRCSTRSKEETFSALVSCLTPLKLGWVLSNATADSSSRSADSNARSRALQTASSLLWNITDAQAVGFITRATSANDAAMSFS